MAYMITHSLLSSWLHSMSDNPYADATQEDSSKQDFLRVLFREPTPKTEAMQNGIDFEALVTDIVTGKLKIEEVPAQGVLPSTETIDGESLYGKRYPKWYLPAKKIADIVSGGQLQLVAQKRIQINGEEYLLYGRLDALKAGRIYDIKFTGTYDRGKFFDSTQHPMYIELVPEADSFTYLITNGTDVWTEKYRKDETAPILPTVQNFLAWLDQVGYMDIYKKYWGAR